MKFFANFYLTHTQLSKGFRLRSFHHHFDFAKAAIFGFCLLLITPLMAQQQGGSILPPPLKRPSTSNTPNAPVKPSHNTSTPDTTPRITVFDDWVHRCSDIVIEDKSLTQCELLQAQQRQQGEEMLNILILAFAIIMPEEKGKEIAFMLTSVVPLDVFLPDGIHFLVDSRSVMHIPFRNCNMNGCWSQIIIEENALNAFKRGKDGLARFTIMNGQEVEIKFSLKGLTSGLNALQEHL